LLSATDPLDLHHIWEQYWPGVLALFSVLLAAGTTVHIVLHKRESRAAAAWAGLVWLVMRAFATILLWGWASFLPPLTQRKSAPHWVA